MPTNRHGVTPIGPSHLSTTGLINASTGMVLDANTEMLAFKYFPSTTSPITAVDINVALVGTSPTFVVGVYADATDAPNTAGPVQLGTDTPGFTWSASGASGLQTFGSNSGDLTVNQPVWIVVKYSSGTIDASNSIQLRNFSSGGGLELERQRHYNGTNWTTTSAVAVSCLAVIKHNDGTHAGLPFTANVAASAANDIFTNGGTVQTQGVRFKSGSQIKVIGCLVSLTKTGTPNDLTFTVYEGDTSKYSNTVGQAYLLTSTRSLTPIWFSSPVLLAADTNLFILLSQTGTSGSHDYDVNCATIASAYIDAILPTDWRFVHGNGTTPSGLTVSTTEFPLLWPLIADPAAELDQAASGGINAPRFMTGGLT